MCEFVSWIECEGKEYFIINSDLETKAGKKLLEPEVVNDLCGHGAIKSYYPELKDRGINKECRDFSNQENFPKSVARAIKQGKLSRIGICLDVLNDKGKKQYNKISDQALAEYTKIRDPALAEYNKINDPALAEYNKINDPAWAEYNKINDPAWAEYTKIRDPAFIKIVKQVKYRNNNWK